MRKKILLKKCILFLTICIFLQQSGFAENVYNTGSARVSLERFSERMSKDVPVSGRVLVGAFAVSSNSLNLPVPDPTVLWATKSIEVFDEQPVCVTTITRDGHYYSEGNLSRKVLSGQLRPFRIESVRNPDSAKLVSSLKELEVAQLATQGDCETGVKNGSLQKILLLSRQKEDNLEPPRGAVLLINSERLATRLQVVNDNSLQSSCESIKEGMRTAFDTVCKISGLLPNRTKVKLQRKRYERSLPDMEFELIWAQR